MQLEMNYGIGGLMKVGDEKEDLAESLVVTICEAIRALKDLRIERVQVTLPGYIEWKVCRILNLKRAGSLIREGYDAEDKRGRKYQVKYRTGDENKSTGFDNIKLGKFDFLLCVFIDEKNFKIKSIYKVPHNTVKRYTKSYKTDSFRWNKKSKCDNTIEKVYP